MFWRFGASTASGVDALLDKVREREASSSSSSTAPADAPTSTTTKEPTIATSSTGPFPPATAAASASSPAATPAAAATPLGSGPPGKPISADDDRASDAAFYRSILEDMFEEEDLLQECKSHNGALIDFLCKPVVLAQLLDFLTTDKIEDETKKHKYPYIASEIFACEIYTLCDAVLAETDIMRTFWAVLDRPPPFDTLNATYFSKVNGLLIQKKAPEMADFLKNQKGLVDKLINHIGNSAISELLLKIISIDEVLEDLDIAGWLADSNLISRLVDFLDPNVECEVHNSTAQTLLDIIAVSFQNVGPQESNPDLMGDGNTLVEQLKSEPIMRKLVNFMLDKKAPNAWSSLANGVNIIIELIRRYCSDVEQAEFQQHQFQQQQQQYSSESILPTQNRTLLLSRDVNAMLLVLNERVKEFSDLLMHPRRHIVVDTTLGRTTSLGPERLKTCELFAEILHLQYLYFSSPLFERLCTSHVPMEFAEDDGGTSTENRAEGESEIRTPQTPKVVMVSDMLVSVSLELIESRFLPYCLTLFFDFPWNNFLHSVVYDMIAKVFNTFSFTVTATLTQPLPDADQQELAIYAVMEEQITKGRAAFEKLTIAILVDGQLTKRITQAQRFNDYEVEQPKGLRKGYMGHLTYISDEVVKLLEKCQYDFKEDVRALLVDETWSDYSSGSLQETKDRDSKPLGGVRPNQVSLPHGPTELMADDADMVPAGSSSSVYNSMSAGGPGSPLKKEMGASGGGGSAGPGSGSPRVGSTRGDSDEEEDESILGGLVSDGDVASEQFARFLCQQMVLDLPDRGLLGANENARDIQVDEGDDWHSRDVPFEMENPFPNKVSHFGEDFEISEEDAQSVSSVTTGGQSSFISSKLAGEPLLGQSFLGSGLGAPEDDLIEKDAEETGETGKEPPIVATAATSVSVSLVRDEMTAPTLPTTVAEPDAGDRFAQIETQSLAASEEASTVGSANEPPPPGTTGINTAEAGPATSLLSSAPPSPLSSSPKTAADPEVSSTAPSGSSPVKSDASSTVASSASSSTIHSHGDGAIAAGAGAGAAPVDVAALGSDLTAKIEDGLRQ